MSGDDYYDALDVKDRSDAILQEINDPNADLIGYTFMIEDKEWKVTKTPVWSDGTYVEIQHGESKTVRPAGLVRKHKLSDWLVT